MRKDEESFTPAAPPRKLRPALKGSRRSSTELLVSSTRAGLDNDTEDGKMPPNLGGPRGATNKALTFRRRVHLVHNTHYKRPWYKRNMRWLLDSLFLTIIFVSTVIAITLLLRAGCFE
ncbi:MAG: hypothetical protein SGPRY_008540 [Prymnesium sp.]